MWTRLLRSSSSTARVRSVGSSRALRSLTATPPLLHSKRTRTSPWQRRRTSCLWAMATTTLVSMHPMSTTTAAAATVVSQPTTVEYPCKNQQPYGCRYTPQDVFFDEQLKQDLTALRQATSLQERNAILNDLQHVGNQQRATLTLIGYKGGPIEAQINQDRAIVVSPFGKHDTQLLAVFDGHATRGELVSEYAANELPNHLNQALDANKDNDIDKLLQHTFLHVDATAPADPTGGCTASVVLQLQHKVYIANVGDSQAIIAIHRKSTNQTSILYTSREDKPSLPDERARIEQLGGTVYLPPRGTSRVLYRDPLTGATSGLAMSRSLGDWQYRDSGVIPNPIVDTVDLHQILSPTDAVDVDDISVFAVAATDGLLDYATAETIVAVLGQALSHRDDGDTSRPHLLTACEQLIYVAAAGWQQAKQGRYRDDIAIAVMRLKLPHESEADEKKDEL